MSFPCHARGRIIGGEMQAEACGSLTKSRTMFLLNLLEAKAVFLLMVFLLIVIPVWILLVAFTKKKGKADSIDAPDDTTEQETVSSDTGKDAEAETTV